MLVPISWLREFTPYEGTAEALGNRLTMVGLELEGIVNPFIGLKDIKVGFVAQCSPHPDSDHMHVCKVDMGNEILDIVCGAPNVAEGQKVAVAPAGATMPNGMVIKKTKLRGQPSNGMICSEFELGLSDDHSGIMVLPESADVGHTLIAALDLDTEVLDISITPNRSDCLSILGIARETSALYNLPLHVPEIPLIIDPRTEEIDVPVEIKDSQLCWLYSGRVVTGATAAQSPYKMRYRLYAVGVRAISNIVDITNYVLFECGQPLHAFDLDKLAGRKIIVRPAMDGEKLVTLDGRERILNEKDLCICDAEKPVALAGVMGGENSEISADTKNIFIESAVFNPASIRKTSRRLGLQSDASFRFERGIDQRRSIWALDRAAALMASICGGYVRKGFTLAEPKPFIPCQIDYNPESADELLGIHVPKTFQDETLQKLGCAVIAADDAKWRIEQPSWRPDLTRPADIIEEVGRIYGLDKIAPKLPAIKRKLSDNLAPHGKYDFYSQIKRWGAGLGLHEVINYSFTGEKDLNNLAMPQEERIAILNPLSDEQNVLKTCLAPGLLQDLANNLAFGTQSIKLFELANIFTADKSASYGVTEKGALGVLLYGPRHENPWPRSEEDFGFADIKGVLLHLLATLMIEKPQLGEVKHHPYLLPCASVAIAGKPCGFIGRVKPDITDKYNGHKAAWLMELPLEPLQLLHEEALVQFKPLPVYPGARRDITLTLKKQIKVADVLEKILLQDTPLLEGAILADAWDVPESEDRNLTFRLTFRHPERTLKDSEIEKELNRLVDNLHAQYKSE